MVSRAVLFPDIRSQQVTDRVSMGETSTGCFGKVYKALYKPIGTVAVKYALRHGDENMLRTEFAFLIEHGTSHPNIVHAFGLIEDDDGVGLVMEFLNGGTLNEIMLERKDMVYTVENVLHWSLQISSALAHMHSIGAIHRDLKPHNLLLDQSYNHLKLCDFGFARRVDPSMTVRTGSWFWMAPEVMISSHYDFKCDVFGIGVIMWQLVARDVPYKELLGLNEVEYVQKICNEGHRPRDLKCIPELDILMKWCWDKLEHRISAEQLRDELYEILRVFDHDRKPPTTLMSEKLLRPIGCFDGTVYEDSLFEEEDDSFDDMTVLRQATLKKMLSHRSLSVRKPVVMEAPILDGVISRPRLFSVDVNENRSDLTWSIASPQPSTVTSTETSDVSEEDVPTQLPSPQLPPSPPADHHTQSRFASFHSSTLENLEAVSIHNAVSANILPTPVLVSTVDLVDDSSSGSHTTSERDEEHSSSRESSIYPSLRSTHERQSEDSVHRPSQLDSPQSSVHSLPFHFDLASQVRFNSNVDLYSPSVYSTTYSDASRGQTPIQEPILTTPVGHYSDQERISRVVNETYEAEEVPEEKDVVEDDADTLMNLRRVEQLRMLESIRSERNRRLNSRVELFENPPPPTVKQPIHARLVDHSRAPATENPLDRWVRSRRTQNPGVSQLREQFEKEKKLMFEPKK